MSPEEQKELVQAIATAIENARGTLHTEEHQWLRERIEKERQRAEFYRKTSQAVFGTVLAASLIWLGSKGVAFVHWMINQPS